MPKKPATAKVPRQPIQVSAVVASMGASTGPPASPQNWRVKAKGRHCGGKMSHKRGMVMGTLPDSKPATKKRRSNS